MNDPTFPTVNLNGTDGEDLLEQQSAVFRALDEAIDRLHKAAPHGRDFPGDRQALLSTASREHESRLKRLREVQEEVGRIMISIRDQIDARKRR